MPHHRSIPDPAVLDRDDPLAAFRSRFVIDDPELCYLDGNSLGRLPKQTVERLETVVSEAWGRGLVRSWADGWAELPLRIGGKIAGLIGAAAGEVTLADSTTVNLFKLAVTALRSQPGRNIILTDALNFPSDIYALQSAARQHGGDCQVKIVPTADGMTIAPDTIASAIDEHTALVELSHTNFKSGFIHDMETISAAARRHGALLLWDLCHSVGSVPVDLGAAGADLAVGCTYKYLNGGPGAPAFLYVREALQGRLENPITGWFGHARPFEFSLEYAPAPGIQAMLTGTPPVLSLAAVEPGVDLVLEAGIARIREKSIRQTEFLVACFDAYLAPLGFELRSPRDPRQRGSHVSLGHTEGLRIARALIDRMGVIPDFRAPDNIRLGVSPLYTTYAEIERAVGALEEVVRSGLYRDYPAEIAGVT